MQSTIYVNPNTSAPSQPPIAPNPQPNSHNSPLTTQNPPPNSHFPQPKSARYYKLFDYIFHHFILPYSSGIFLAILAFSIATGLLNTSTALAIFTVSITIILTTQSLFTLCWMLYAWEDPRYANLHRSPTDYLLPKLSFTALIPARHEHRVIADTIRAVHQINYPDHLKEIIILCRSDDSETILAAQQAIDNLNSTLTPSPYPLTPSSIKLEIFSSSPINKPHTLNEGLKHATNQIITIFDAEDQPHPNIYNVVNTLFLSPSENSTLAPSPYPLTPSVDVIQSGVQLMNYRSHWFSTLNVLEYFFWFKSGLHFFSRICHVTPLGGNTVFFKKSWLQRIGGWDETNLTEDADIGLRLSLAGARTRVVYDELHVTQEETPTTTSSFLQQRTRWNQGFLQILAKSDWQRLPTLRQRLAALYILLAPEIQALLLLYTPIGIWIAWNYRLPMIISLLSFAPMYLFILQIIVYLVGLYEFTHAYRLPFNPLIAARLLITFIPYQFLLAISSLRAIYRTIFGRTSWEKTLHLNAHRETTALTLDPQLVVSENYSST